MRNIKLLLMLGLMAALLFAGAGVTQQSPDQRPFPPREFVRPAPISLDDLVERIMAFDKDKKGKVTKDDLPERMHHLIALGDTNKDGALDRDEVKKLVTTLASAPGEPGGFRALSIDRVDFRVGPGPGPGFGARGFGAGPGPFPGPGTVEGIVDDLKLPGKKKDQAMAAVTAHEENVAKLMHQAREELLQKMKEILSEEEFNDFKAALDRPRGGTAILGPVDGPRPGGVERRIEQGPKEEN
jgi:hypothetical protein